MKSPPRVLLYGRVLLLLQTRRMVLESAGFLVSIATDIDEVEGVIESRNPDLLILCHTLPVEEKTVALATVRAKRPQLQTLTLNQTYAKLITHNGSDVLTPVGGPIDLIAAAKDAVNRGDRVGPYPHGSTGRGFCAHAERSGRTLWAITWGSVRTSTGPETREGLWLLTHEVAHVLQQGAAYRFGAARLEAPDSPLEAEADAAATALVLGRPAQRISAEQASCAGIIRRKGSSRCPGEPGYETISAGPKKCTCQQIRRSRRIT